MAKQINRREFLKRSVLGVGSLVLASSLQAINNASNLFADDPTSPPTSDQNLMALYKQAKEYFYQKRYSDAVSLFNQLIASNPNVLYLYDGLASVYGAQQNLYNVAELYLQGVNANPNNAFFLHRYGLSLRKLCLGNAAQAQNFASQHNISNLYETAAEQVLTANSLNPKECFALDLKDFPRLLERYNNNVRNSNTPLILSVAILSQISAATFSVSTKWTNTRASRKPAVLSEDDYEVYLANGNNGNGNGNNGNNGNGNGNNGNSGNNGNGNNGNGNNGNGNNGKGNNGKGKNKRNLNGKDKEEREKNEKKSKNRVSYIYMKNNMNNGNANKVERWGLQILSDDIKDTNSVGQMRKYFRKHKHSDRVISINRYFYNNNENIFTALALAASLAKYQNSTPALNEAKQLLNYVNPHLDSSTSITKGAYYITAAKIKLKENNQNAARAALLEGLEKFDGKGGVVYSLMETYTTTFKQPDAAKAINIQKALCNKQVPNINDPIWNYLEKYRNFLNENEIHKTEKIKALIALSKLQQKFNDSGYGATINEINTLKNS